MPAPPARMRSASVPCGQNSTSSSPARNCRSNSAFSPTYDEIIFRICRVCSSRPRPQSSTPALFETQVRPFTPRSTSALMRFSGMPQSPKPPTTSVAPSKMSRTASPADATTLFIMARKISKAGHGSERHMKRLMVVLALLLAVPAFAQTAKATFAGGCFWCTESDLQKVPGVISVVSGYTGGRVKNASYEQVSAGGTGHFESVEVTYDPRKLSYGQLLDAFWHDVDPFDAEGQFCDK